MLAWRLNVLTVYCGVEMVILWILGALFLALIIIVPLVERFSSSEPSPMVAKMSKYIYPILAIMLVAQIIMYYVKG